MTFALGVIALAVGGVLFALYQHRHRVIVVGPEDLTDHYVQATWEHRPRVHAPGVMDLVDYIDQRRPEPPNGELPGEWGEYLERTIR